MKQKELIQNLFSSNNVEMVTNEVTNLDNMVSELIDIRVIWNI